MVGVTAHSNQAHGPLLLRGIEALGHSLLVETNSAEFAAATDRLLRSFAVSREKPLDPEAVFTIRVAGDQQAMHHFYRNGKLFRETDQFWKLVRLLEWQLDIFLWRHERRHMLMHAGAVQVGDAGLLIPGSSRAGKSSLTLSLLLRGGRYFSDEVGVVTTDSRELMAFPKPVSSRVPHLFPEVRCWFGPSEREVAEETDGWTPVWFAHPDDIRPDAIGESVQLTHIVFPEPGSGPKPAIERMGEGDALRRLLQHTVNFENVGRDAFHALADIVRKARAYRLMRNGMESTADLVMRTIAGDRSPA